MVAAVAVGTQEEALRHQLDALGRIAAFGRVRNSPLLRLDRNSFAALGIRRNQIELPHQPKFIAAEGHASGDFGRRVTFACFPGKFVRNGLLLFIPRSRDFGLGQEMVDAIDAAMRVLAFLGVFVVFPTSFDVHEVESAGAIGMLGHHVHRGPIFWKRAGNGVAHQRDNPDQVRICSPADVSR